MMHTTYDPEADAFYARFAPEDAKVAETKEVAPGVMIDLDAAGRLIGIEVLGAKARGADSVPSPVAARSELVSPA